MMSTPMNGPETRSHLKMLFQAMPEVANAAGRGYDNASSYQFSLVGIEHLLLAMVQVDLFADRIKAAGGSLVIFQRELVKSFKEHRLACDHLDQVSVPRVSDDISQIAALISANVDASPLKSQQELMDDAIDFILQRVDGSAVAENAIITCGAIRILSICEDAAGTQFQMLSGLDGSILDDITFFAQDENSEPGLWALDPTPGPTEMPEKKYSRETVESARTNLNRMKPKEDGESKQPKPEGGTLNENIRMSLSGAIRNLSAAVDNDEIDPVVGRDGEIDRIISILKRRRKSSVIIHGDAGVGKTAIAEGVARALCVQDHGILSTRPVYEVKISNLVSGTRFRGDFEERMKNLIHMAMEDDAILFMDEIHLIMGAGAASERGIDAANILKPALARGEITVIGATTSSEMRAIRSDAAMMRRFDTLLVREPTRDETARILEGSVMPYIDHHNLALGDGVIESICRICDLYQPEKRFPDKAFDLLDAACVVARESLDFGVKPDQRPVLTTGHVEVAADQAWIRRPRIPDRSRMLRASDLKTALMDRVKGQDRQVAEISARGLEAIFDIDTRGVKFVSVVAGPEASGKGEIVRVMADQLKLPLVRIEGSTLHDASSMELLAGSAHPRGQRGLLCEAAEKYPEALIHFRDADLAHPSALSLLDDVIRTGYFTNGEGRQVSLRSAWIIFTLTYDPRTASAGFGFTTDGKAAQQATFAKLLPPGILKASTPVILDVPGKDVLLQIITKVISDLETEISGLGLKITLGEKFKERLLREHKPGEDIGAGLRDEALRIIARSMSANPSSTTVVLEEV